MTDDKSISKALECVTELTEKARQRDCLLAIVKEFVEDIETAFPAARKGDSLSERWFDLSITYRNAKNILEDLGIEETVGG